MLIKEYRLLMPLRVEEVEFKNISLVFVLNIIFLVLYRPIIYGGKGLLGRDRKEGW